MKKFSTKIFTIVLITFVFLANLPIGKASAQGVNISVNGVKLHLDVPPTIIQGRTLVPLRGIFEALGVTPDWNPSTQTVTAKTGTVNMSLSIGNTSALVNGEDTKLDVPAMLLNGRTLVPGRFIAETLGASVNWNASSNTVEISHQANNNAPHLEVHFIDVGQGDAILLLTPSGSSILIDAGPATSGQKVVSYLKEAGVSTIDKLVATHPHEDHIGGMANVLAAFPVKEVIDSGYPHTTNTYETLLKTISAKGISYKVPKIGEVIFQDNSFALTTLFSDPDAKDANAASLVLRAEHGSNSFLFTGDAEKGTEDVLLQDKTVLRSTVLKVGHHGSTTSTSPGFGSAVKPEISIIQVGNDNRYGHPDNIILTRLNSLGSKVYRTDLHGSVVVNSNGTSYSIRSQMGSAPAPAPGPAPLPEPSPNPKPEPTPSPAPVPVGKVDINRAGLEELKTIIHISDVRAKELISLRPFRSVDDLIRINGIGEARLADIKKQGVAYVN